VLRVHLAAGAEETISGHNLSTGPALVLKSDRKIWQFGDHSKIILLEKFVMFFIKFIINL
jgi:hypothetical protein